MNLVQCRFERVEHTPEGSHIHYTVGWVDASWELKPGVVVEFRGDPERWTVIGVGEVELQPRQIHHVWRNNI